MHNSVQQLKNRKTNHKTGALLLLLAVHLVGTVEEGQQPPLIQVSCKQLFIQLNPFEAVMPKRT
jgi:hypothetical protein